MSASQASILWSARFQIAFAAPDSEPTVPSSKSPVTKEDENDDENLVVEEKVQIEEPAQPPPPPPTIEKIAEEDKRRPHPVKRALYKVFPFLEKSGFRSFYAL